MKIAFLAALLVAGLSFAARYTCQIDDSSMLWTGKSRSEWGKLLHEYRCMNGHTAWVVQ